MLEWEDPCRVSASTTMHDLRRGLNLPAPHYRDTRPYTLSDATIDLERMMFGGLSSACAQTFVQPIETVKVRLQNEGGAIAAGHQAKYKSFLNGFRVIFHEEGVTGGLFKGMAPSVCRELFYSTLRFGLYTPAKQVISQVSGTKAEKGKEPLWSKMLAGAISGGLGSAISNPFDLLKAKMQANAGLHPPGMLVTASDIIKKNGVIGLWRGTSATVSRAVILGSVKLASYDEVKMGLQRVTGLDPKSATSILLSAAVSGLVCAVASAPADFTRTRLMSSKDPVYKNTFDVVKSVLMKEGPFAFYRGFLPQWARIAPYSILQFVLWEHMCAMVGINAL